MGITLPNDMANVVKSKVQAGEYASESEVIRVGLRALIARDRAVETWLTNLVGPAYDALKADPSRAVTADLPREPPWRSTDARSGRRRSPRFERGFRQVDAQNKAPAPVE